MMNEKKVAQSTQEQAIAAWVETRKIIRLESLKAAQLSQSENFRKACEEMQKLKGFVGDLSHVLGNENTKHGEIAEHVQVRFSNAEDFVKGRVNAPAYDIDSVNRTARADYLRFGQEIQSKFCNGTKVTFEHICSHLETYPSFLKDGGAYDIPRDQYKEIVSVLKQGKMRPSLLKTSEFTLFRKIEEWEKANHTRFEEVVKPSVVDYDDVQLNRIDETIGKEETKIQSENERINAQIETQHKPSLNEGIKTTTISAAIEGGVSTIICVYSKVKAGRKISSFDENDWKDIGISGAKGVVKGGIRGGTLYAATNYMSIPAPVANAFVSVTFGVVNQANLLRQGLINEVEFLDRSEAMCFEVAICTVSAMAGQVIIPIPILGAIIGNAIGNIFVSITENYLSEREQEIAEHFQFEYDKYLSELEEEYFGIISSIRNSMNEFESIVELCFDPDINRRLSSSVELARACNVDERKILHNIEEIDSFFLGDKK